MKQVFELTNDLIGKNIQFVMDADWVLNIKITGINKFGFRGTDLDTGEKHNIACDLDFDKMYLM